MQKLIHSPEKLKNALDELKNKDQLNEYINRVDNHGDTLVHFAARSHSLKVLQMLKEEYGADFTVINEHGRQALHEAIDSIDCVSYIINNCNVDVNALKRGDWTPVMIAALKGRLDIIQVLEKAGANLDLANKDGRTALHLAIQHGHVEASKYLAQRSPSSINKSTKSGRLPIQIAAAYTIEGEEPQQKAKRDIWYDLTTFLFLDHVKTSLAHRDKSGRGLLQDAAVSQNLPLVRFLLTQGADPNQVDSIGRNVIHHAAMMGHLKLLELLFKQEQEQSKGNDNEKQEIGRFDWDVPDRWDEWTPLMHASRQGHFSIVQFLVQHGLTQKNFRDKHGRKAKDIGLRSGITNYGSIVQLIDYYFLWGKK
ncbi:ankyrin repeat-containing domain protein [Circinella umbellata]|nr:ankyrin repeat-containing domain protein [Circinella umbellata]